MRRLSLAVCVSIIFFFCPGTAAQVRADSDWQEIYNEAKEDFVKGFEEFRKEGIGIDTAKDLFEKLQTVGGKHIEGTGTETLLNTLHKQAENVSSLLEKKETLEQLIDFLGDVYALSISDTPPDGVQAYKALQKGVALSSKLADKIPVLNKVAVPMINAYAKAIKNGEKHIEAIAAATQAKNRAIELGYDSWPLDELSLIMEIDEDYEEPLTREEQLWQELLKQERDRDHACAKKCESEYIIYDRALTARNDAIKSARTAQSELDSAGLYADTRLRNYNDAVKRYKQYHQNFNKALDRYNRELARAIRAGQEGDTQGEAARREMLAPYKEKLDNWKGKLRAEFSAVAAVREKYLNARVNASRAKDKYKALSAAYEDKNDAFQKADKAYEDCIAKCLESYGSAPISVFAQDLAGFNAAAGNPPIAVNFDNISSGTDISGRTISGVKFISAAAPLVVVNGNDTFTPEGFSGAPNPSANKLFPTSGANVLSPGGLELAPGPNKIQNDALILEFQSPVSAFGFDHLSQSADGASYTSITVLGVDDSQLFSGGIPISALNGGGAPGGPDFWGIVSGAPNIAKIKISESDNDSQYPDANIGFDTFRFNPPAQ